VRHAYRAYLKLDRRIAHPLLSAGDPRASAAGQGYFCGSGAQPFGDGSETADPSSDPTARIGQTGSCQFHPEQAHIIGKLFGNATLLDLGHYLAK